LEGCEVEKDITSFIRENGTGQEIPDPPRYINFCRGDINDTASETSEDDNYSVAQFQRTINPAFRSSSPAPSTYESHHDPQSELAIRLGHHAPETPPSRETTMTPQKSAQQPLPPQIDYRRHAQGQSLYQQAQQIDLAPVPHNEYPTDGMTMFCRTDAPSERSSATSPARPRSRDSQSEYSNPTSFSSQEPPSGKQSPVKQGNRAIASSTPGEKQLQKRRSGFFSNSPFRRKSKHEREDREQQSTTRPTSRNTWGPSGGRGGVNNSAPGRSYGQPDQSMMLGSKSRSGSPEPVDPRANFQLNIGNNVFDVASPEKGNKAAPKSASHIPDELDPIAQALAELKGVTKQSSVRMSADRYHGLATPAPTGTPSLPSPMPNRPLSAAQRGTPPPSYNDQPIKRLDLPQPAFTSAQMQQTTRKYIGQAQDVFTSSPSRPGTRGNSDIPRATSPAPLRSTSPRPAIYGDQHQQRQVQYNRSVSPNPYAGRNTNNVQARPRQSQSASPTKRDLDQGFANQYSRHTSPNDIRRAASPQPQYARQERPGSSAGMQLQLAPAGPSDDPYGGGQTRRRPVANGLTRPISYYGAPSSSGGGGGGGVPEPLQQSGGGPGQGARVRSRSVVDGRQYTRDGRPVIHYGKHTLSLSLSLSSNSVAGFRYRPRTMADEFIV